MGPYLRIPLIIFKAGREMPNNLYRRLMDSFSEGQNFNGIYFVSRKR